MLSRQHVPEDLMFKGVLFGLTKDDFVAMLNSVNHFNKQKLKRDA